MIYESSPWKEQLLRDGRALRRLSETILDDENDERAFAQFERLVFIGAYAMRKLWESGKLSTDWDSKKLPCDRFPFIGTFRPDVMNSHKVEQFYDLNNGTLVGLKPEEFCDRIIHSFIFEPVVDEQNRIFGVHFTSDRLRSQCLWFVRLAEVASLLSRTGKDYPSQGVWIRTADGGLKTWQGNREPPLGWIEAAERQKSK